MLRGSKTPLKVKENERGCPGQKGEASLPPPRDQKSCKVPKPIRPSKKENFSDGSQARAPNRAHKCSKGPEEVLGHPKCDGSTFGGLTEPPLPLHSQQDFGSNDFSTPDRDEGGGKAEFGLCEQRGKPVDFAAVTGPELGVAQESFGGRGTGTSPNSRKLRRRSTIGLRGSPENNTLIRYLAQQRSSRQKEAFTQISPFEAAKVRPLKDKIDAFQTSFGSLQEAEGEPGLSHLPQERGSSQSKSPLKKEPKLQHWSEKFTLGNRGAAWKGNSSGNGTKRSRSELRICSILSPHRVGIVPDPAAAKEWVFEQQNPVKSLETVVTGGSLEASRVSQLCAGSQAPGCDHGDAVSDLSPSKAEPVEDLGVLDGNQTPGTPLGPGNSIPSCELSQSSSLLRSILKKTPGLELRDSPREYPNSAFDRGEGESAAVSNCVKAFETLQTETSDNQSPKTPRKKKVTFGQVLSPEIFDQNLPANTPLRRGASPGCPHGHSPGAGAELSEEPLPLLDFGGDEEGVEPLPELLEGSVPAEAPPPVENAAVAESDKPATIKTRSTKRKKTKYPVYGKRRKKKVKRSLYGERQTASRKPLLSPIPEIPEAFSPVSSPNPSKADELFTEDAALGDPSPGDAEGPPGGLDGAAEFSVAVPDAEDTSEYFQQGEETPCKREAEESSSLSEKEDLQGNLLTGLEILEQQDVQEAAQRTKASTRGDPARRRRRSSPTFFFPPAEKLGVADVPVSSYSLEEVLSAPRGRGRAGSLQGRNGGAGAELRVRRSMRLSRDSLSEGLAWVQLPGDIPRRPGKAARRSSSSSILAGAENVQLRKQNPLAWPAPGKENDACAPLSAVPGRRKAPLKASLL